jgi:hypothetical protein
MGLADWNPLKLFTGVAEDIGRCAGLIKPKNKRVAKIAKYIPYIATIGAGLVGGATLLYGMSEVGPTPPVLIGSLVVAGLWYLVVQGIGCKMEGRPLLLCVVGSMGDVAGNLVGSVLPVKLPDPKKALVDPLLKSAGCKID